MAKSSIMVKILGDAKGLTGAIGDADSKLAGFGKASLVAAGIATTAVAGFAVAGVKSFADFEKGMNEVYTLMPGISSDAMGAMADDVKSFSKDFGVLPSETIPALYQSLSAGVPADNVFSFMETAQKAAKGGVTDLSTAVDGISTVVNAFGSDVISAGEASDLMFTTVRLGKTTFEEMSAAMSNVAPVASALGISFEDVTAGIAVLTAQGVPTAQATTQMRSAFAELGKSGSVADKAFKDMAGKSFPEFIAEGGNVQEAFQLMADGAEANGSSLIDMFGSIEAGQAVMALTKGDGEAFASALDEMQKSAGATDAAYAQMNTGLAASWSKIKASFSVALIGIGEKLAPFVQWIADRIPAGMQAMSRAWSSYGQPALDAVIAAGQSVVSWFKANWPTIQSTAKNAAKAIGDAFAAVASAVEVAAGFLIDNKAEVIAAIAGIALVVTASAIPAAIAWTTALYAQAAAFVAANAPIVAIAAAIAALAAGFVWAYQNVEWFRTAVDAVVAWMRDVAWPTLQVVWDGIKVAVTVAIEAISEVVQTVLSALSAFWDEWGAEIMAVVTIMWNGIKAYISGAMTVIQGIIKTVSALISGDWSAVWQGIQTIVSGAWTAIRGVVSAALGLLSGAISAALAVITGAMSSAWNTIKSGASSAWSGITSTVTNAVNGVGTWVSQLPGKFTAVVGAMTSAAAELGGSVVSGLKSGLSKVVDVITSPFKSAFNKIIGWWNGLKFTLPKISIPAVNLGPFGSFGGASFGGQSFGVPKIGKLHTGGPVGSLYGPPKDMLYVLQQGEYVQSRRDPNNPRNGGGGGGTTIINYSPMFDNEQERQQFAKMMRDYDRQRAGAL